MQIGVQIKRMREAQGISQESLAKKMGIKNQSTLCQYETGRRRISADRLPLFAAALGCGIEDFYKESTCVPQAPAGEWRHAGALCCEEEQGHG